MVSLSDTSRLTPSHRAPSIATAGAVAAGVLVAAACLAAPTGALETLVVESGAAALVNAAAPPLGLTARVVLAAGGGALAAALVWAVLVLVSGERRVPAAWTPAGLSARVRSRPVRRAVASDPPSIRRADSHPDAPPRPPILAERDLGAPFLSIVAPAAEAVPAVECPLPRDLDTALAAVDPAAIPAVPREPIRPVASLTAMAPAASPPLAPGERIDTVELGADVRDRPDSIEALLARLERGARRRAESVPAATSPAERDEPVSPGAEAAAPPVTGRGSLEETLGSLRRLATHQ
ncbi:MAG: hypothetical protein ACRYFW_16425 [Janthinobacterium lividum]